jgi:hypothetical protein
MRKIINHLNWFIHSSRIKSQLLQFCKLEYADSEVLYAYNKVLLAHKHAYLQSTNS